jgi:hypothetical protein
MTTSPFSALVIFSNHRLLRILSSVSSVAHPCNGNHGANVKLLKLGSWTGIQVASFRNVCEISEQCSGARAEEVFKGDLLRDWEF